MSEPRKYGYVFQLLVKNSTRFKQEPYRCRRAGDQTEEDEQADRDLGQRHPHPSQARSRQGEKRRMKPPGVPFANWCSCVPIYVGAPGCRKPGSESFWTPA